MLIENKEKRKLISKWLIAIFTICILIYLGVGHLSILAEAIKWITNLFFPLLLGVIFAIIFNVPMCPIEEHLFSKTKNATLKKLRRPLSIVLSFVLVFGIFIGISFLVVPELINAVAIVIESITDGMDQMAELNESIDLSFLPFGSELSKINIDWLQLKIQLQEWFSTISDTIMNAVISAFSSVAGILVNFFIALVFSIYILANKETLIKQAIRLIHVWLPERIGNIFIHVTSVCSNTFRLFIAGQATEAIILGLLCTIGMLILQLPYAPMIGSLVGVTALIPIVGAYVGTIVGVFMILTVDPFKALIFVIFLLILQQIEGNLIYPRVVGAKINLPAMWVLAAITIGGNLAGPVGMLLGVPAASSAYALLREATDIREQKKKSTMPNKDI